MTETAYEVSHDALDVERFLAYMASRPNRCVKKPNGKPNYDAIRKAYSIVLPELMQREGWVYPYFVDWVPILTPIELQMWYLLRAQRIPFYPQFPVGRFFVDFGNPHHKVAIECDGKRFHQDEEKDYKRELELYQLGWRVVRFSGHACYKLKRLPDVLNIPPFDGVDSFDLEALSEEEDGR